MERIITSIIMKLHTLVVITIFIYKFIMSLSHTCLLYTSDAADDRYVV